ncbi:MAG: flavin reductase family protein [Candidatus Lokiarchaeota archaeon]|nr:flavin reductase family protein [Candidatus Lokiarchaeota archaeon]
MKVQIDKSTTPIVSPAVVISVGDWDNANLITLAWVARVVSEPPVMSVSIRPSRHSFTLIEKLGEFVINIPNSDLIREMDYCGTRTGRKTNKWEDLNLTKQKGEKVSVPLIKEFPMNIECKVTKRVEYGSHMIYLGEVITVHVEEGLLKDGKIDPLSQDQIVYIARNYYGLTKEPLERQAFSVE